MPFINEIDRLHHRKFLAYIREHPGCTIADIHRDTGLARGRCNELIGYHQLFQITVDRRDSPVRLYPKESS